MLNLMVCWLQDGAVSELRETSTVDEIGRLDVVRTHDGINHMAASQAEVNQLRTQVGFYSMS